MTFTTADLCDAYGDRVQILDGRWRWFGALNYFSGPISTIAAHGCNGEIRNTLAEQGHGQILVVDAGHLKTALIGENLAVLALRNGWAGLLIHGNVRDAIALGQIELGIIALGSWPARSNNQDGGQRDAILHMAGSNLEPQQWLYADEDGVLLSNQRLPEQP